MGSPAWRRLDSAREYAGPKLIRVLPVSSATYTALDAGDIHSLHNIAQPRLRRGDTGWTDVLRYGLDAAGSPVPPW